MYKILCKKTQPERKYGRKSQGVYFFDSPCSLVKVIMVLTCLVHTRILNINMIS